MKTEHADTMNQGNGREMFNSSGTTNRELSERLLEAVNDNRRVEGGIVSMKKRATLKLKLNSEGIQDDQFNRFLETLSPEELNLLNELTANDDVYPRSVEAEANAFADNNPELAQVDAEATAEIKSAMRKIFDALKKAGNMTWEVLKGTAKITYKGYELLPLPVKIAVHLTLLLGSVYLATEALALINAGLGTHILGILKNLDFPIIDFSSLLPDISNALANLPKETA